MFRLDMESIRKDANDYRLMANLANAANLANEYEPDPVSQLAELAALAISHDENALEPPADPNAWRELAQAYHAHHFNCPQCIAAGRGAVYGDRCDVGSLLWSCYQNIEGKK